MNPNRRDFLRTSAGAGLALPFVRSAPVLGQPQVFAHGVASGDPQRSQVLLWTRVSGAGGDTVSVGWQVALDEDFREVVAEGTTRTGPERDHTVKALATGLRPGTTYRYRFEALGERSPVGRTKTLARDPNRVRLAFVSCSNLPFGYFNVYRRIAERDDLDAVLHLGDYLYEYANSGYGDGTRFTPSRGVVPRQGDHRPRRLPRPPRPVQVGPGSPGGPPAPSVHHCLGRPRNHEQRLDRRGAEPPGGRRGGRLVRAPRGGGARLLRVDADPRAGALAQPADLAELPGSGGCSTSSCSTRASSGGRGRRSGEISKGCATRAERCSGPGRRPGSTTNCWPPSRSAGGCSASRS